MSDMTLADLAAKMRKIDFTTLTTRTEGGALAARPMSNNGDVEFDGDCFFFAYDSARSVSDITADPHVSLALQGSAGLLGKPPLFITIQGSATLIRDKAVFADHWTPDLDYWFKDGIDTPGVVMIHVRAERVHYWDGTDEGEIAV